MTDPLEEALAASTRTIQHLDQQLAATREANARLTAKVVQLEIQLRAAYTELRERDDAYEAASEALLNARDQLDYAALGGAVLMIGITGFVIDALFRRVLRVDPRTLT